jgi:hypothetical protein
MEPSTDLTGLVRTGVYDVIRHQAPAPDPKDEKYIKHTAQVIGMERFNGMQRPVRRVAISGVHLSFDTTDRRGIVQEYNGKDDIKELYIVADTVAVSRALTFPQTNVFIICRSLEFNGANAVIDTSPKPLDEYRELLNKDGLNGPGAGNITLYVARLTADTPGLRFIARGAAGQPADEGEISNTSTRKDIPLITKEQWEGAGGFSYAHRHVVHEKLIGAGEAYTSDIPADKCDWQTFQKLCRNSITYVEFKNAYWTTFFHTATEETTVFTLGTKDEPGQGGNGMPPGKPGTGGAGGNLMSTVQIDRKLRDIAGGRSAPRHPGTRGGAGGTPEVAHWVLFQGKPAGTGAAGANHSFGYQIVQKTAVVGKASGPGPEADKPKGDDGKDVDLWSRGDAKEKCAMGWVTPLLLNIAIQYAKDAASAEQPEAARAVLQPYATLLASRTPDSIAATQQSIGFPKEVVGGSDTMLQLRDEVTAFMTRLDQHLDSFGNPPGWVPNLTLTGAVGAYDAVRDIALKELYGAYYLEKMWKQKQDRSDALKQLIGVLIQKTQQLRGQMIDTRNAIMQRGYVAPADPTVVPNVTVDDLTGAEPLAKVPYNDMSLLEKLRSLIAQMEDLEKKRLAIEKRLKAEADKDATAQLQWEAAQAGLKISSAVLKALPLPPPYEQAASAFGGLLDVTSSFMEKGGDDAAFANLKTQVSGFLDGNQDQLVKLFTKSMDEELSAYNDEIKSLETAAKDAKKAKDELQENYDAKVSAAEAARQAEVKALSDRSQQRLRQRQRPPDPTKSTPKDFNTAIAEQYTKLKSQGDKDAKTSAAEYTAKSSELTDKTNAIEKKTEAVQEKIKATAKAKETRAESTKNTIEKVKKVVEGVEQIAKAVNKLAVSETQLNTKWNEALAKIKSKDAEFQAYIGQIAYLNEQKKLVVGRLVKLLNDLQDQRQQIARNLVAINELRTQYAKSGADDLDQGTLLYVQAMRQDAHRRLTAFLYYVIKAYEYYTVTPWNRFYEDAQKIFEDLRTVLGKPAPDVTGIFDPKDDKKDAKEARLKQLITAPGSPDLSDSDWSLLKYVYEKPLRDMGIRMLEQLITGREKKIDEREQHVTLDADDLSELNSRIRDGSSARMTINLARLDQLAGSNERQRIGGFKVVKAVGRKLGPRPPDDITFKVIHVGRSIVRYQGRFYAFQPQAADDAGGGSTGVTFETGGAPKQGKLNSDGTLTPDGTSVTLTADVLKQPESKAQETLISKLLGSSATIDLSEFRPGAFSDFLLTVEFTPRDRLVEFSEIEFVVMMEKGNTDQAGALVGVFTNRDLSIDISTSWADKSGRSAGIGRYIGIYDGKALESKRLVISVPGQYGDYRHTGWIEGEKLVSATDHSRTISAGTRVVAVYESATTPPPSNDAPAQPQRPA